jgi:threonine dehydrogenase-like Zn-dependent dehydrogenase
VKQKFKVLKVEDDALVGENVRTRYSDMASLEAQRADGAPSKKALIIGAVVLGVVAIAAAGSSGGGGGGY